MPYKDLEKRREAVRRSVSRSRAAAKVVESPSSVTDDWHGRPLIEDAEAVYGDSVREQSLSKFVSARYGKSRTWGCIMYPDSAPSDWEDRLRLIGVGFAVSPLHDMDTNELGELKKPHWHVILDWRSGSTTYKTAFGISRDVLCGTIPIPLVSPRGYYRYFTHLDNPNKAQYDQHDIVTGNGFDIGDFLGLTAQEESELLLYLQSLILKYNITEYWVLCEFSARYLSPATHNFVCRHTIHFSKFLAGYRSNSALPIPEFHEDDGPSLN